MALFRLKNKASILFLAAFVPLLFSVHTAQADSQTELTKKLTDLKQSLAKTERQLSNVESELEKLDKKISLSSKKIVSLRTNIKTEREELDNIRRSVAKVKLQRGERDEELVSQIRSMYLIGRQPVLKLVLNQESPNETGRLLKYFDYFNKAYVDEIASLSAQQKQLERLSSRLQQSTERMTQLIDEHSQHLDTYNQQRDERRQWVTKLKSEKRSTESLIEKLMSDQRHLDSVTRQTEKITRNHAPPPPAGTGFAKLRGQLPWPVKGEVIARFGRARLAAGQLNWRGILIKADEGDNVRSISSGTVVFSDWLRGYGYVVIVDHGRDYMSLYGHNQALFKEVGEKVDAGEVIALVGQTGSKPVPALYFEIRYKGDPVNPQRWIVAQR